MSPWSRQDKTPNDFAPRLPVGVGVRRRGAGDAPRHRVAKARTLAENREPVRGRLGLPNTSRKPTNALRPTTLRPAASEQCSDIIGRDTGKSSNDSRVP
jgi:hypothetical protein